MVSKRLIYLIALTSSCNILHAQQNTIPAKIIDSLNREFIIYALKANGQPKNSKAFADSTAKNYNHSLFRKILNEKTQEQLPDKAEYLLLSQKINDLKKLPPTDLDSIMQFYRQNPAFNERLTRNGLEFEPFSKKLELGYKANLRRTGDDSKNKHQPVVAIEEKNFLLGFEFLSGLGSGIGVVILLGIISRLNEQRRRKKNSRKEKKIMNMDSGLDFKIIELERQVKELKAQLKKAESDRDDFRRKYDEAVAHLDEKEGLLIEEIPESDVSTSQTSQANFTESLQYFPSPLSDGSFRKVDGKNSFVETASIYCFRLKSDNEAEFDFCAEPSSVSMALNNRNDLILSVAEEMEGNAIGAKKIITYKGETGRAILEDSKWIVVKKVKIKYI